MGSPEDSPFPFLLVPDLVPLPAHLEVNELRLCLHPGECSQVFPHNLQCAEFPPFGCTHSDSKDEGSS